DVVRQVAEWGESHAPAGDRSSPARLVAHDEPGKFPLSWPTLRIERRQPRDEVRSVVRTVRAMARPHGTSSPARNGKPVATPRGRRRMKGQRPPCKQGA